MSSPRKIVTVLGASGNQGGSVVRLLLNDATLKTKYAVRAVTRDTAKASAKALQDNGAELVVADVDDTASLQQAFKDSYAVFGMTDFWATMSVEKEVKQGKNIVDAAIKANVKHLVWSSLPNAASVSNGQLVNVLHFDGKAEVEQYAESQKGDSLAVSYLQPPFFMSNFKQYLSKNADGTLSWAGPMDPLKTNVPLIDAGTDTGKFVVGLLEAGVEKANGVVVRAVSQWTTPAEAVQTLSNGLGRQVNFNHVPLAEFVKVLPPASAVKFAENMALIGEFDFYGKHARAEQAKSDAFLYNGAGPKVTLAQYIMDSQPWSF